MNERATLDSSQTEMSMGATGRDELTWQFSREFLASLGESGNTRNAELAANLCAEDVLVDDHGDDRLAGRDAVRELFDGIFRVIPDIRFRLESEPLMSEDRRTLSARWRITGTRPNGEPFDVSTVDFYTFREGLVVEYTIFVRDLDWLGRQMP